MCRRKVLISPEYGAGFSTWACKNKRELAEDKQLIEMVEKGKHLGNSTAGASREFVRRVREISGRDACLIGVRDLEVVTVRDPYEIIDDDGYERAEYVGRER